MIKDLGQRPCKIVSKCSAASKSESKVLHPILTNGKLVGRYKEDGESYEACRDKKIYFDLSIDDEFDHGQILVILRGPTIKRPSIKIYGDVDEGNLYFVYYFLLL